MNLANPQIENEEASDNPHAACGPASVASIINDAGRGPVSVTQVNDWMRARFGSTTGGVPQAWNQAALAHWNVPSTLRYGSMKTILAAALAAKHEVIIWHQCNGCADPVRKGATSLSHYRVAYGDTMTMNPGYAFCGRQPLETVDCAIGDMGTHLEVMQVLPKDQGDISMADAQAILDEVNRLMASIQVTGYGPGIMLQPPTDASEAGHHYVTIPVDQFMQYNLTPQGRNNEKAKVVIVLTDHADGHVVAVKEHEVSGTVPNQRGPLDASGDFGSIGAKSPVNATIGIESGVGVVRLDLHG